jgi:hypothetical protein
MTRRLAATGSRLSWGGLLVTTAFAVVGCSDGRLPLAPVEGTISVAGKPLASGRIVFQSDTQRPAYGRVVDGRIVEVTTYETGDGAALGRHSVGIQSQIDDDTLMSDPVRAAALMRESAIPPRYHQSATSGLEVEILPRRMNTIDIDIQPE